MPTVRKSVIVPHTAQAMFDLVDRCEDYPEFLPWCAGAEVMERSAKVTRGRLDVDFRGFRSSIVTENRKKPPGEIHMALVDGPFESFDGRWTFAALGDEGCKVTLEIEYTFSGGALQAVTAPVFGYIAETLVERFVERADQVSG